MNNKTLELSGEALLEILVDEVGIDADMLAEEPGAPLSDFGLDSMAQVELGVVLRDKFGVAGIPEEASTMSFDQLASHLCPTGQAPRPIR
jgi:acyl carrier protein